MGSSLSYKSVLGCEIIRSSWDLRSVMLPWKFLTTSNNSSGKSASSIISLCFFFDMYCLSAGIYVNCLYLSLIFDLVFYLLKTKGNKITQDI